jgi:hypothetical protein
MKFPREENEGREMKNLALAYRIFSPKNQFKKNG